MTFCDFLVMKCSIKDIFYGGKEDLITGSRNFLHCLNFL